MSATWPPPPTVRTTCRSNRAEPGTAAQVSDGRRTAVQAQHGIANETRWCDDRAVPHHTPQTISYPAPGSRPRNGPEPIAPHVIVLFGACGDLARRKLLPGLARLTSSTLAPDIRVVGTSLEDLDDYSFLAFAKTAVEEFGQAHPLTAEQWDAFAGRLRYVPQGAGA